VVVIHGLGEQRPMATLRSFVASVLDAPEEGPRFFSRPDRLSESFELRVLQNRQRPRTHFYEYYWAYHADGTKFMHVVSWLFSLLWRSPKRVPRQLIALYVLGWMLALMTAVTAASGGLHAQAWYASAVVWLLLSALQFVVLSYIDDAARYLSPSPANIMLRHRIRADGLKLMRKLHDKQYQRIIVVGHSLGSVIAYDILRQLWTEMHQVYQTPHTSAQPALAKLEEAGERTRETKQLGAYQAHQTELFDELRALGSPWRVTDLITLGSPLAHAALLLAEDEPNLRERQAERELPTCPPLPEIRKRKTLPELRSYAFKAWSPFVTSAGEEVSLRVLHHAAPFAVTKWTNLYFPARWGLFGDPVAGPLASVFGYGIRDLPVQLGSARQYSPTVHAHYWSQGAALQSLRDALSLAREDEPEDAG
jgi:hypothetical protein